MQSYTQITARPAADSIQVQLGGRSSYMMRLEHPDGVYIELAVYSSDSE